MVPTGATPHTRGISQGEVRSTSVVDRVLRGSPFPDHDHNPDCHDDSQRNHRNAWRNAARRHGDISGNLEPAIDCGQHLVATVHDFVDLHRQFIDPSQLLADVGDLCPVGLNALRDRGVVTHPLSRP